MPTIAKQDKKPVNPDNIFIADDDLQDVFIPDASVATEQIPQTDDLPEILTDPVQAGKRAEKTLETASQFGLSISQVEKNFQWTQERIDKVKDRFNKILDPSGNVLFPSPVNRVERQVSLNFWWREEGQFLPPEILTELGIEGGEKVPTVEESIRAQKKLNIRIIKDLLNIKQAEDDPLKDQMAEMAPFAPAEPGEFLEPIEPTTMEIIKAANQQDIEFLADFVTKNFFEFPGNIAKAIRDEVKIRQTIPDVVEAMAERPLIILLGTDFFNKLAFGLPEFTSRKGLSPTEALLGLAPGTESIWIRAVARVREQLAREDPRLLTQIGLSSGEILSDIIKFVLIPDPSKAKVFAKLPKAAKAAIGVGTKAGLIELLQAPEEGETLNERLGSVAIATGSGAIAGAIFSLSLSGLQAVGAKIGAKIGELKTEALRKAFIKRSPKLEAYIKTLDENQLNNLRNAINDSAKVQTGEITQSAWDSSHKSFLTALAKDAIQFTESQAGVRPSAIVPQGFRAAFAEIGPTEPGKKLGKKAAEQLAKQAAAQAGKVTPKIAGLVKSKPEPSKLSDEDFPKVFREIGKITSDAEKNKFRAMTPEERALWRDGTNWEEFSRKQGYSEAEIEDFRYWTQINDDPRSVAARGFEDVPELERNELKLAATRAEEEAAARIATEELLPRPGETKDAFRARVRAAKGIKLKKVAPAKVEKAPTATTGEPRTLPESTTEQLTADIAELEKWRAETLARTGTQADPQFAEHLGKQIANKQAEIKQIAKDKEKITKLLRGKTFDPAGRSVKEIAASAAKNILQIAKSVPDMLIKVFEPAKLVERRLGPNVYSTVIKGIMLPEVRALEFNERVLDAIDTNFGELEEFFAKFSDEDLKNFMLSRGQPRGEIAKRIQQEASVKVPQMLQAPEFQQALKEIAEFNYQKLVSVAEGDINKVKDYFYGIYDESHTKIDKFLDKFYRTTKRFLKEKKLPTVADAAEYGLTLKSDNPVTNLKSEWAAISRLEGMQLIRDELMKFSEGEIKVIGSVLEDIPDEWVKIGDEPVFKGLRAHEDLARMINNLISTNKISAWMPLRVLRGINNVLRIFKFAGSGFHLTVEASQAIADTPLLNPGSSLAGFTTGFRINDPIFKTPEYRDYIGLGGTQRGSIEAEAQKLFNEIVTALGAPGTVVKTAISPLIIMNMFTEWMFNSYIPKLKYVKYLDFVADTERKLGRGLTDAEKINIIKEGQNFYGEMNERLFGRSGTVTSALRFIFLAPGFAEGNYRTIAKGAVQWGIGDSFSAKRSRRNVVNSLLLKLVGSTIGTLILTGSLPKRPTNFEEVRDLFKIDTGLVDDKGRKIFIDTLTYDKDYYNLLVGWAQHGTVSLGKEILRRIGGMRAPLADMTYDLITVAFNKDIYDWKGDKVILKTDPILTKLRELALFELKKIEPISVSVLRQGLNKGMNLPVAILQAITGTRTTFSEAEKRKAEVLRQMYELWGEREEVFISVRTTNRPRARIAAFNKNVKRVMGSKKVDPEIKEEFENELLIDTEQFLRVKQEDYLSSAHTLKEAERIKELLVNFKLEPKGIWEVSEELSKRMSTFTETRRRLKAKVDDETATTEERTKSFIFNGLQTRIGKVARAVAETDKPERQEQLVDVIENMLSLTERE